MYKPYEAFFRSQKPFNLIVIFYRNYVPPRIQTNAALVGNTCFVGAYKPKNILAFFSTNFGRYFSLSRNI